MAFAYTILPDGTIFKLEQPDDYVEAARIAKDEAQDVLEMLGYNSRVLSVSAVETDGACPKSHA